MMKFIQKEDIQKFNEDLAIIKEERNKMTYIKDFIIARKYCLYYSSIRPTKCSFYEDKGRPCLVHLCPNKDNLPCVAVGYVSKDNT